MHPYVASSSSSRYDDVDTAAVILRLTDGTLAVLGQTRHDPRGYDIRMEIIGSNDAVTVGLGANTPLRSLEADAPAMPRSGLDDVPDPLRACLPG